MSVAKKNAGRRRVNKNRDKKRKTRKKVGRGYVATIAYESFGKIFHSLKVIIKYFQRKCYAITPLWIESSFDMKLVIVQSRISYFFVFL